MSEKSKEQERGSAPPAKPLSADLPALARRLREAAEKLPAPLRDDALSAADQVHEHANSERPDKRKMSLHLQSLATIAELAPAVNALLEAISGVGM